MEKRKILKIIYFCFILSAIAIMLVPGIYIVRWMSPPDEPSALWLTSHSYLDIKLLGMANFFPLITGFFAILSVLCHIGFKETNKIVFTLTVISLFASIFSVLHSYSIDEDLNQTILFIDGLTNHLDPYSVGGIIITGLLFLSLACQFIYMRTK